MPCYTLHIRFTGIMVHCLSLCIMVKNRFICCTCSWHNNNYICSVNNSFRSRLHANDLEVIETKIKVFYSVVASVSLATWHDGPQTRAAYQSNQQKHLHHSPRYLSSHHTPWEFQLFSSKPYISWSTCCPMKPCDDEPWTLLWANRHIQTCHFHYRRQVNLHPTPRRSEWYTDSHHLWAYSLTWILHSWGLCSWWKWYPGENRKWRGYWYQ